MYPAFTLVTHDHLCLPVIVRVTFLTYRTEVAFVHQQSTLMAEGEVVRPCGLGCRSWRSGTAALALDALCTDLQSK